MAKVPIGAVTITRLSDGVVGKMIDAEMKKVNADMIDRGHDGKVRKLQVELTFTPDDTGHVAIEVTAMAKLPKQQSPATVGKYDQAAGGYLFNTECAANPDQMTLSDLDGE